MSKFIKIIINRKSNEYRNIHYLPQVVELYKKFSKFLFDDYFLLSQKDPVSAVVSVIEKTSPYFWIVYDEKKSRMAGFVFLDNWVGMTKHNHSAEVTTCFYPDYWGKYTKLAAKKFVKYCFKKYKIRKLRAYIFPQNKRVQMLLKTAGFKKEALLKSETLKNGELQDIDVYSIIKN